MEFLVTISCEGIYILHTAKDLLGLGMTFTLCVQGAPHPQDGLGSPGQEEAGAGRARPRPSTTGLQAGPAAKLSVRGAAAAANKLPEVLRSAVVPIRLPFASSLFYTA